MTELDETTTPPHYHLAHAGQRKRLAAQYGDAQAIARWAPKEGLPLYEYRPMPQARRFHQSHKRWRFLLGGNRSGKSAALAQETLWAATGSHPWRHYETPNDGWYSTTSWDKVGDTLWEPKLQWMLRGIRHDVVWHNKQRNIPEMVFVETKDKGARKFWSKITFKSIEAGRESYQAVALRYIFNDEQFPRDIWIEQNSRIGAEYSLDIACAFTPIDPQPWLQEQLTTDIPPAWDVFELPLDDNRIGRGGFIPDELIDAMIETWPPEVRETRRLGRWGSFLGAIFQTFNRETHVVSEEKERRLFFKEGRVPPQVHSYGSIDWGGANPFVFLWACRVPHIDDAWFVYDEYFWAAGEHGPRRLEQHADEIKSRTKRWETTLDRVWADHDPTDAGEFYHYGVPSNPAAKDVRGGIETMQALLNPRANLSNADFPKGRPRLFIAARCKNLIREMGLYRWREGTGKNDPKDEPLKANDHCLAGGTLITTRRGQVAIELVRPGDEVLTRHGYFPVRVSGMTSPSSLISRLVTDDGRTLRGTIDHRVWTENRGFVRMDSLRYNDCLTCIRGNLCHVRPEAESPLTSELSRFSSTGPLIDDTPTRRDVATDSISQRPGARDYTGQSGCRCTAPSRTIITSTTRTTTRSTTTPETWNALRDSITSACTEDGLPSTSAAIWKRFARLLPNGIGLPKGERGTSPTAARLGKTPNSARSLASIAQSSTRHALRQKITNSARTGAGPTPEKHLASMTRTAHALFAGTCSGATGTPRRNAARSRVREVIAEQRSEPVYDLTIDGPPEFFANGILVHNCVDAARYLLFSEKPYDQMAAIDDFVPSGNFGRTF